MGVMSAPHQRATISLREDPRRRHPWAMSEAFKRKGMRCTYAIAAITSSVRPPRVRERIVNHRGLVAIAPNRVAGSRSRIGDNEKFKSLLDQVAQMGFYAHIVEHATEHDVAHVAFAQLEYEIVCLRAKDLVRSHRR